MARCYTPPDYIALLDAVRFVAEAYHPDKWIPASMSAIEARIWNGLGTEWNPEFIEDHLRVYVQEHRSEMIDRIASFERAKCDIRDALCNGIVTAYVFNDLGRGLLLASELWRNTVGELIIRKGTGWFDEGDPDTDVCRCVFLRKSQVEDLHLPFAPDRPKVVAVGTSSSEAALCRAVTDLLRNNPSATKAQAQAALEAEGFVVSGNRFRAKIWPQARVAANLPEKAGPGKKRATGRD